MNRKITYAVTRPVLTSASKAVDVNCRNIVVTVKIAVRPVANQAAKLFPTHICRNSVYGAGEADRIIETIATFGRRTPGPSSRMPAIIEQVIPVCTVIAVLKTTAAIAIDLVVQPASTTFFQARLLSVANHRKLI